MGRAPVHRGVPRQEGESLQLQGAGPGPRVLQRGGGGQWVHKCTQEGAQAHIKKHIRQGTTGEKPRDHHGCREEEQAERGDRGTGGLTGNTW